MFASPPAEAVLAVALLGAIGQAAVAARWYEPPKIDERNPNPLFEAGVFFVLYGLAFVLLGSVLSYLVGVVPPYGGLATLLLVPIGFYAAYAGVDGRLDDSADRATNLMRGVFGAVLGAYPLVLLGVSLVVA